MVEKMRNQPKNDISPITPRKAQQPTHPEMTTKSCFPKRKTIRLQGSYGLQIGFYLQSSFAIYRSSRLLPADAGINNSSQSLSLNHRSKYVKAGRASKIKSGVSFVVCTALSSSPPSGVHAVSPARWFPVAARRTLGYGAWRASVGVDVFTIDILYAGVEGAPVLAARIPLLETVKLDL